MAKSANGKPSLLTRLAFGVGGAAEGIKNNGFEYVLLFFYSNILGVNAGLVAIVLLVALIIDAVSDPVVGYWSDNLRTKYGRRHPFMYAALIPVALSYYFTWNPLPGLSENQLFIWLFACTIAVRLAFTFYEVPSTALAAELTQDYDARTSLMSIRYFFGWFGGLTMTVLALQVFLKPDATHPVGQLNPAGYQVYALVASAIMFGAIMISAIGTHKHIARFKTPPVRKITIGKLAGEMFSTLTHRSFLVLMGAGLFNAMAQGLVLSLNLYFNTYFWELSAGQVAFLAAGNFVSAALAFALAAPLSKWMGKKPAAQLTKVLAFVISFIPISLRLLDVFPANGAPAVIPILFLQTILSTAFSIIASILISSMIADVVEDSELRTGRRSEGLFFSAAAFVAKAVSGVGIFASSMILVFVAFPQGAKPGQVSIDVIRELGVVYLIVLAALYGAAITCVSLYRITRAGHAETLSRLAAAAAKEGEGPAHVP